MGKKSREKQRRTRPEGAAAARPESRVATPPPLPWPATAPEQRSGDASSRWWIVPALLFGGALLVRFFLLVQVANTPYLEVDNIDAKGYQVWASQILGGDWLPLRHFYQSPLYAYYLAAVYALFGTGEWAPRLIQVVLGSASVVLLYQIAARLFSRRVGLIAAALLAIYGPMITEEIMLAKTALVVFTVLLAVYVFLDGLARSDRRLMAVAGALFGVTIIGVGQWLPAWLLLAAYVASGSKGRPSQRRPLALAFVGGGLLLVLPLVAWNSYWGGGLMLTSGDAGLNLFVGNNPLTTGLPGRPNKLRDVPEYEEADSKHLAEQAVGSSLSPSQVSRYWSRRAVAWAVENPGAFTVTMMQKLNVLWNSYEFPDSYHYAFIRQEFMPALWACLTFAIVGPLALAGMVLVASHRPARPLYLVCLGYLAVITIFYVRARYRMPAIPFLIIFAAAAIDWGVSATTQRQWSALAAGGAALLVSGAFVNHRYCEPARGDVSELCLAGDAFFDLEWMKLAQWHHDRGDLERERDNLSRATLTSTLRGPGQLYFWLADSDFRSGEALLNAGKKDEAMRHYQAAEQTYQRVIAYHHRLSHAYTNLSILYRRMQQPDRAAEAIASAVRVQPNDLDILQRALRLNVELGRCTEAHRWFEQIEQREPGNAAAKQLIERCSPAAATDVH
jgi:4-amino-4-deoxy-L-arabinose transferase-like glycosyltransferase